jgi:undecaprenyl-diphosphatase
MNSIETFNHALFLHINGAIDTPTWIVDIAIVTGDYLIYLIPALLLMLWLHGTQATRNLAVKACLVAMLGIGINQIIPLFWQHPRPFMEGLGHTWISHAADSSFPSDHMTVFSAVGLTLLLDGAFWIGLTVLMAGLGIAWARVFLGVHFPLDMVGAVGIAVCSYLFVSPLWHRTGNVITALAERLYRAVLVRPIAAGWLRR